MFSQQKINQNPNSTADTQKAFTKSKKVVEAFFETHPHVVSRSDTDEESVPTPNMLPPPLPDFLQTDAIDFISDEDSVPIPDTLPPPLPDILPPNFFPDTLPIFPDFSQIDESHFILDDSVLTTLPDPFPDFTPNVLNHKVDEFYKMMREFTESMKLLVTAIELTNKLNIASFSFDLDEMLRSYRTLTDNPFYAYPTTLNLIDVPNILQVVNDRDGQFNKMLLALSVSISKASCMREVLNVFKAEPMLEKMFTMQLQCDNWIIIQSKVNKPLKILFDISSLLDEIYKNLSVDDDVNTNEIRSSMTHTIATFRSEVKQIDERMEHYILLTQLEQILKKISDIDFIRSVKSNEEEADEKPTLPKIIAATILCVCQRIREILAGNQDDELLYEGLLGFLNEIKMDLEAETIKYQANHKSYYYYFFSETPSPSLIKTKELISELDSAVTKLVDLVYKNKMIEQMMGIQERAISNNKI